MGRIALLLSLWAARAGAEAWRALEGAALTAALSDRKLVYDSGWQQFYASGRTLYNTGRDSWGYWEVRGDAYCSQWPPADGWDCYVLEVNGDVLRFVGSGGDITEGRYAE